MSQALRTKTEFFNLGMQYYVAGRFAGAAGLLPVAGNLLHHAIESFLKGGLAQITTEADRRKIGHRLPDLWEKFKGELNATRLSKYDHVIGSLDKLEEIRYPEKIVQGIGIGFGWKASDAIFIKSADGRPEPPQYSLSVGEIDALVLGIFGVASINPKFFELRPAAREYLVYRNDDASAW